MEEVLPLVFTRYFWKMSVTWTRRALLNGWLSLLEIREGRKDATAHMCRERSVLSYWLAGHCRWGDSRITSATKFFRYLLPIDNFRVLHLAAVPRLKMAKWLTLYLLLNQNKISLTLLQKDCLLGWRECCPCRSGTWSDRRTNASSAGRWGLASPGWYPGGPGIPGTAHWRGTVAASSSPGPCNPPGHLQKGEGDFRAMVTRSVVDFRVQELFPMHTTKKCEFTPT